MYFTYRVQFQICRYGVEIRRDDNSKDTCICANRNVNNNQGCKRCGSNGWPFGQQKRLLITRTTRRLRTVR